MSDLWHQDEQDLGQKGDDLGRIGLASHLWGPGTRGMAPVFEEFHGTDRLRSALMEGVEDRPLAQSPLAHHEPSHPEL